MNDKWNMEQMKKENDRVKENNNEWNIKDTKIPLQESWYRRGA